ncbi:coiled-coil domain-containing protein 181 isoform 2-T2 [Rhinophrynus dorsalis]
MNTKVESDSDDVPEYEDDFEKDLDWLINEDMIANADAQNRNGEEDFNEVNKQDTKLINEENGSENVQNEINVLDDAVSDLSLTPVLETVPECEENDVDDEEAKRYIAEKIEEANKLLEKETIDEKRERKLKFKDNLIDLEVPPLEYSENDINESSGEDDIVDGLKQLQFSDIPQKKNDPLYENGGTEEEHKDGKILVEKDGKFELVTLRDIESHSFLPPIPNNEKEQLRSTSKSPQGVVNGSNDVYLPQPPNKPKVRPSSATNIKSLHRIKSPRRVQSASLPSRNTFCLSSEQKEQRKRMQERQEKLKKEEEERRKKEEEEKRRENEIAFKAWLQKKRSQLEEEKRIQQAKQMEHINITDEERNPKEAYNLWLKRKYKERVREKKIEELKKQESFVYLHEREDSEKAFKQWLREKRIQKRAENLAAKERSRRLIAEARRKKQIQNLLYNISDSKPLRYVDNYT